MGGLNPGVRDRPVQHSENRSMKKKYFSKEKFGGTKEARTIKACIKYRLDRRVPNTALKAN